MWTIYALFRGQIGLAVDFTNRWGRVANGPHGYQPGVIAFQIRTRGCVLGREIPVPSSVCLQIVTHDSMIVRVGNQNFVTQQGQASRLV